MSFWALSCMLKKVRPFVQLLNTHNYGNFGTYDGRAEITVSLTSD